MFESRLQSSRHRLAIVATYFFLVGAPGFWIPVLSKVMDNLSWGPWIVWAYTIPPVAGLLSPLAIAAQADQRVPAQRVLAAILLIGTVLQIFAFRELQLGQRPWLFLTLFSLTSLLLAPCFGLLNTITLASLNGRSERFGLYRVWGTIGWIVAGLIVSGRGIDGSATVGYFSVGWQLIALACCVYLPNTVPLAKAAVGLRQRLGFGAFQLLKRRDLGVVIIFGGLFMMPLTSIYMHTSLFLGHRGFERIASTMAIGQISEIVLLLSLGWLMSRFRPKILFMAGIIFGILRFILFATGSMIGSNTLVVIGIVLHGCCWGLFFEFARTFLDKNAPVEFRAQVQGLFAMSTAGFGSICGTIAVAQLYDRLRVAESTSWAGYWFALTVVAMLCGIGFMIGFRRETAIAPTELNFANESKP